MPPIRANTYDILFCLNNFGIFKNEIPKKMFKQQIDINIKEEKKFTSPDIDLYRPSSLIKFLVNEYPIWLVSR